MIRRWPAALLLCCILRGHAADFADDSARSHRFASTPQRVVTLAPSLTELVEAAGAGARLVASVGSQARQDGRSLPSVGDFQRIDVERLLQLKPDLVLVWTSGNSQRELSQISAAGVPVVHLEPRRLDDVARAIERLGGLFGTEGVANARAQRLRSELDALARAHAHKSAVRVFYQVWPRPLLTLSDQHLIGDVIRLCGGVNVFARLSTLVPEVSTESVVAAKPEVILSARASADGGEPTSRREPQAAAFATWLALPAGVPAARHRWLFTLPGDEISRQGPRIVLGAKALCEALDVVRSER